MHSAASLAIAKSKEAARLAVARCGRLGTVGYCGSTGIPILAMVLGLSRRWRAAVAVTWTRTKASAGASVASLALASVLTGSARPVARIVSAARCSATNAVRHVLVLALWKWSFQLETLLRRSTIIGLMVVLVVAVLLDLL